MKLQDLKEALTETLYRACVNDIALLKENCPNQPVISYAILGNRGFDSIGSAACTQLGLQRAIAELIALGRDKQGAALDVMAFSDAWDCINPHAHLFRELNRQCEAIQNAFYDGELEDIADYAGEVDNFYYAAVLQALEKLKANNHFTGKPFEKAVFIGLQFSDPSRGARQLMAQAARELNNSKKYHDVITRYLT